MCTPILGKQEVCVGGSWELNLLHGLRLLRRLGPVRSASALTFAGVLARVLLVTAALALAVVLTFAGVLRKVLFVGCNRNTGNCRGTRGRFGLAGKSLGVETSGGAAEKAGEGRGQ